MADETTQFILADAAVDAVDQPRNRRLFSKRKKPVEPLTKCENCDTPLAGEYCSACGQHAIDYRRSLWRVGIDALDSLFNWDTKFLQTVGVLLMRPWRLTNDFNAGRRVRYVHPLRLYLLASIAFFLLAKLVNFDGFEDKRDIELTAEDRAEIDTAVAKLLAPDSPLIPEQRARIEAARQKWAAPEPGEGTLEERALFKKGMMRLRNLAGKKEFKTKDTVRLETALAFMEGVVPEAPQAGVATTPPPADFIGPPIPRSTSKNYGVIQFDSDGKPKEPLEIWLEGRVKEKFGEDGTKAEIFLETLRSNIPTMMLACVPLFAFVLKVLYIRQRRYYVEDLVCALHIHTFVYVAVVVITMISMGTMRVLPAIQPLLVFILSVAAAVQVFLSIRRVYKQGWIKTTFKCGVGGVAYVFVLSIGVSITAFITLIMP
ncbi:MAG TPA: DUF3667 domain-containing protein [Chthoniobacterales bacterium]|nr:DUF3667 domain-containing protein [Chthoniobacterales bacterium]